MKPSKEKSLVYRVIDYAMKQETFCINDITTNVPMSAYEHDLVVNVLFTDVVSEITPNTIFCLVYAAKKDTDRRHNNIHSMPCMLLPSAVFSYTDHLEIVHARETAAESKRLAWIAIFFSGLVGGADILVEILK